MAQKLNHVMVDLETLDTEPSASIISIGAVRFDEDNIADKVFYRVVSISSNLAIGRTISDSTMDWWEEQSAQAREVLEGKNSIHLVTALNELNEFIGHDSIVWGNGAMFDNAILRNACKMTGVKPSWKYHQDACYRTLKQCFPNIKKLSEPEVPHHALYDAMAQALHCQRLLKKVISCDAQ
jgi:DNA polymerase III epsilon subunit-like protein